jgi:hypothetical protein
VTHSPDPEGPLKGPFPLTTLSCMSFPPPGKAVACPLFPTGSWASPDPNPIPQWSSQGFCLRLLVPTSQTDSTRMAYSSPWWWRQQGPLKRW